MLGRIGAGGEVATLFPYRRPARFDHSRIKAFRQLDGGRSVQSGGRHFEVER